MLTRDEVKLLNRIAKDLSIKPMSVKKLIDSIKSPQFKENIKDLLSQTSFKRRMENGVLVQSKRENLFDDIRKQLKANTPPKSIITSMPVWIRTPYVNSTQAKYRKPVGTKLITLNDKLDQE
jgi:hypothetical protein